MLDNRKNGAFPSDYQDISPVDDALRGEPETTPSIEWLKRQSPEVRAYYAAQLKRVTIIGIADPEERALELAWNFSKTIETD